MISTIKTVNEAAAEAVATIDAKDAAAAQAVAAENAERAAIDAALAGYFADVATRRGEAEMAVRESMAKILEQWFCRFHLTDGWVPTFSELVLSEDGKTWKTESQFGDGFTLVVAVQEDCALEVSLVRRWTAVNKRFLRRTRTTENESEVGSKLLAGDSFLKRRLAVRELKA